MSEPDNKNEIVVYQADNLTSIEVKLGNDTVWLNRHQIASLFNRDVKTIGKHITNVFLKPNLIKMQLSQILRQFKKQLFGISEQFK